MKALDMVRLRAYLGVLQRKAYSVHLVSLPWSQSVKYFNEMLDAVNDPTGTHLDAMSENLTGRQALHDREELRAFLTALIDKNRAFVKERIDVLNTYLQFVQIVEQVSIEIATQ